MAGPSHIALERPLGRPIDLSLLQAFEQGLDPLSSK